MIAYVDINLSSLRTHMGKVIPGVNIELVVIRYYKMNVTAEHNTIAIVNNYICNYLNYTKEEPYSYDDILAMVKEKHYNTTLFNFLSTMEHIILQHIDPNVIDVEYVEVVDKENLIVKFKLTY